jgi:exopolysaccharide biosynthesis polyprenyl glycosylphosphotransferase
MNRASRASVALRVVADLLIVGTSFVAAYSLRFRFGWLAAVDVEPPEVVDYAKALVLMVSVFLLVFRSRGLYGRLPSRGVDILERTTGAVNIGVVVVLAASFFYREFSYSRSVCLIAWALICVLLPLPRLGQLSLRRRRYARGEGLVPVLIVGSTPAALELLRRLADQRRFGVLVKGIVRTDDSPVPDTVVSLGDLGSLETIVRSAAVEEVLIPDTLERLQLFEILEVCARQNVATQIVPRIFDLFVRPGDLSELYGVPFVSAQEERLGLVSLAGKRGFDILVGGTLLLLFAPLIGLLALWIRRETSGPALFVQYRVGLGGEHFPMWKLRSMVVDAEERLSELVDLETLDQPVYKIEDDPRVTGVGRLLRRWSLDELPNLWNVVTGDMSLVGPRPEVADVVAHYDAHQRRRLKAKPGLTGLQQVEARGSVDLDERIALDVYYIRRRSFVFDLYLLLRTPWAVLSGRGAT